MDLPTPTQPQPPAPTDTPPSLADVAAQMPAPPAEASAAGSTASVAMTLSEHLAELRARLITIIVSALVGIAGAFYVSLPVIEALKQVAQTHVQKATEAHLHFVQLTPGEVLLSSAKLSVYLGLALASPIILYQALAFVLPGLHPKERRQMLAVVLAGSLLFALGVAFAYTLVIPSAVGCLLDYGQQVAESQISIARYIDFCTSLLLLTGIVFELPLLLFFLSITRLLSSRQLIAQWRTAAVVITLSAALITPSQDPFTMILVVVAMGGLYALSIIPIKLIGR